MSENKLAVVLRLIALINAVTGTVSIWPKKIFPRNSLSCQIFPRPRLAHRGHSLSHSMMAIDKNRRSKSALYFGSLLLHHAAGS